MKLFSIVGAFNILANNPIFHLGAFIVTITMDANRKGLSDADSKVCRQLFQELMNRLAYGHLVCFILLSIFHIVEVKRWSLVYFGKGGTTAFFLFSTLQT